jgi:AraC-like DNA-binding protein
MRSFYELEAERNNYYYFKKKHIDFEGAHFHSAIELLIVIKGQVEVSINGKKRTIESKEGVFVDSFDVHSYKCSKDSLIYVLVGNNRYFSDFFNFTNNKKPTSIFKIDNLDKIDILYKEFESLNKNKEVYFLGLINIILSYIMQDNDLFEKKENNDSSLICSILKFVDEHYQEDLSIDRLSKEFGYSKEHLSRLLHKYLNENWNNYLNRKRINIFFEKRKGNPHKNILELAFESGFNSQSTFYRAYRKNIKMS